MSPYIIKMTINQLYVVIIYYEIRKCNKNLTNDQ